MRASKSDLESPSRRQVMAAALGTGFAMAVRPVSAETILTSADGLDAAGHQDSDQRGRDPRLSRVPQGQEEAAGDPGRARDLRRSRAHQGRLPAPGQVGLPRDRARAVRAAGRCLQAQRHRRDSGDRREDARRPGPVRPRRDVGWSPRRAATAIRRSWASRGSAGAGGSSGSMPRTTRR